MATSKEKLIFLLQNAHAGEKAAAFAYNGHARSLRQSQEKVELQKIESEEWDHRERLFKMLFELGTKPRTQREWLMSLVGRAISFFCILGGYLNFLNLGWFLSMYGAGKLERGNIVEYEIAARYAKECGYEHFVPSLLNMAEVEWDHELYFRTKVMQSRWTRIFKIWSFPPARPSLPQQL